MSKQELIRTQSITDLVSHSYIYKKRQNPTQEDHKYQQTCHLSYPSQYFISVSRQKEKFPAQKHRKKFSAQYNILCHSNAWGIFSIKQCRDSSGHKKEKQQDRDCEIISVPAVQTGSCNAYFHRSSQQECKEQEFIDITSLGNNLLQNVGKQNHQI